MGSGTAAAGFRDADPSVADAEKDDQTISVCIGRAKLMDCGGIVVMNAYAYRATDPDVLHRVAHPVGIENDMHIDRALRSFHIKMVIAAWGQNAAQVNPQRMDFLVRLLTKQCGRDLYCLGTTKSGAPRHPLRIPYSMQPRLWRAAA